MEVLLALRGQNLQMLTILQLKDVIQKEFQWDHKHNRIKMLAAEENIKITF